MKAAFFSNRWAVVALWVLGALYACALFADFLAPYSFKDEARDFSYAPPTAVHFIHEGKWRAPFVYGLKLTFSEYRQRIYVTDRSRIYPLKFFSSRLVTVDAPGRLYALGADSRGRDVFSRILYGARVSLTIGVIGVLISFVLGLLVGGIAGYYGGRIDNVLMRLCEVLMMAPGFYLLLALRAAVPDNFNSVQVYFSIVVILSVIGWAGLARVVRGMCLSLRERDYVLAAKTFGLSDFQIIIRHILPHTVAYSIAAVMLSIPGYILGESALSLIGLGIQDPYASWGNMLSDAMSIVRISFAPWILWPAFFIFISVVCFNLIGDALRDALDPTLKRDAHG
ncbi:MAG: ABC transporter permease [Candidatus Omnitrophota bacterium]